MKNYDFEIFAIVVLPEHFHILLKPNNICEYPKIISSVKHSFSRNFNAVGQVCPTYCENKINNQPYDRGKLIWQRRYYEHTIINDEDLIRHLDYIHYNPMKHQYSSTVKDWEYSSFKKFVNTKNYELNWGSEKDLTNIIDLDYD